jgi:glycosyltransferase involved in cell wall biosynthesis
MRILEVLTYYHPHWTGLTAYAKHLSEALARRGHSVTVLTSRHRADLPLEETIAGVRVVRLPVAGRVSRGVLMPSFPFALWRLMREADVVQLHSPILEAPLVTFFGRLLRRPVVFTHHGDLTMPAGGFNQAIQWIVTRFMNCALRQSTHVVAYSRDYAENSVFLKPALEKLDAILPPVVIPEPDAVESAAWRSSLGIAGRPVIGFAGRWVEEKGFDYLLRAIPDVLLARPNARFLYAGETSMGYEDFFSRCAADFERVREHVELLGLVLDPRKLADFYAMLDVLVLPSRTDCLALVQVEAMLSGTPVVVSDIPGARVVVSMTGMGVRVAPRDPAALARGILQVLDARATYVRPRETIARLFDADRCALEYEDLFTRLTAA